MAVQPHRSHLSRLRNSGTVGFVTCAFAVGSALPLHAGSQSASSSEDPLLSGTTGVAQREIVRRLADANRATELLVVGDQLQSNGDYLAARNSYGEALNLVKAAPGTVDLRNSVLQRFAKASVSQAETLAKSGAYDDARAILTPIAEGKEFVKYKGDASSLLKRLSDPASFNPAVTSSHVNNVQQVQSLLFMATDLIELGKFDDAYATYQEVIRIDQYNSSARRGMERVAKLQSSHASPARSQMRASMLREVDEQWEEAIATRPENLASLFGAGGDPNGSGSGASVKAKLTNIILPNVVLEGASLREVVDYLVSQSRNLDRSSLKPEEQGISIVIRGGEDYTDKTIDLNVSKLPLGEVLRYAAEKAGMRVEIEPYAVALMPLTDTTLTLLTRTYRVPPGFIETQAIDDNAAEADPFADSLVGTDMGALAHRRLTALEFLQQQGIIFPDGAAASYNPKSSMLMVRNTQENIDFIESLIDQALSTTPRQVQIKVTMLEILKKNVMEVGYDFLLDHFNVGGERVFATGGTEGNQRSSPLGPSEFAFATPGDSAVPIGTNPVTLGLRDLSNINQQESIDNVLIENGFGTSSNLGRGGMFSLAGVFTDPQFQMIMRKVHQSKSTEIMASPSVLTKSGQRTVVEIGRSFPYPVEFDPPEVPDGIAGFDDALFGGIPGRDVNIGSDFAPITPTTPTSFETRNLGFNFEAEPVIGDDNRTIDLNLSVESVAFEGFINYGSPISDAQGAELTPNEIFQPVFRTTRLSDAFTIYDGQTIAIGGYIGDVTKDIEDEVPLIGRLPGVGHFFRSTADDSERRHIVVLVTCNILDPAGQRINAVLE